MKVMTAHCLSSLFALGSWIKSILPSDVSHSQWMSNTHLMFSWAEHVLGEYYSFIVDE